MVRLGHARALILASALVAGLLLGIQPGVASCAGPTITARMSADMVRVTGHGWFSGCNDTGGGCGYRPGPTNPVSDIKVYLIGTGGQHILLGTANANSEGAFSFASFLPNLPSRRYPVLAVLGGVHAKGMLALHRPG